jgi:hypothetical protein
MYGWSDLMWPDQSRYAFTARAGNLPPWALALPTRAQHAIWSEFNGYTRDLTGLTADDVRRYGRVALLRAPNVGVKTVHQIGEAIGGWITPEVMWPERKRP